MDTNFADIKIDRDKALMRFTMAEIRVRDWCKARGFGKSRFYDVLAGNTLKYRTCLKAMRVVEALKREGLLVLAKSEGGANCSHSDHVDQHISSSDTK